MEGRRGMKAFCTTEAIETCKGCDLDTQLKCRFTLRDLIEFYVLFLIYFIPPLAGMLSGEYSVYLWGWAGFSIFFFGYWEIRILCSHCPYYAERGLFLRCIGNYGLPKLLRYNPSPISRSEKIQFIAGLVILLGYPLPFLILEGQTFYTLATLLGLAVFLGVLIGFRCPRCVNFSCLFNRVPQETRAKYEEKNG
jgi:hypothetical protein